MTDTMNWSVNFDPISDVADSGGMHGVKAMMMSLMLMLLYLRQQRRLQQLLR